MSTQLDSKNADNSNELYTLLGVVEFCPISGKKYKIIEILKCDCECHNPLKVTMCSNPCCDDGFVYKTEFV